MTAETTTENLLHRELLARVADEGGMTFADYMAQALYHPRYGYYMTNQARIGKEGDFYTSSNVHSLFGGLIARQLHQMWQLLGEEEFTIAEQGPGEAYLSSDILDALAEQFPDCYARIRYRLVEHSELARDRQKERLARHLTRVDWCSLDDLAGMQGCFLSNELIDAFPVHLIEMGEKGPQEVYVVAQDGQLSEELRPPSTPEIERYFRWLGVWPAVGNRAEVNLSGVDWMRRIGDLLRRGFVLTIDYGYPANELYAPWRREGTLLCYHRHQTNENPYQHVGRQDITAHIDFTALEKSGLDVGLETLFLGEQYRFLMGLGFVEALIELQAKTDDPQEAQALRLTLKNLILPDSGMGGTFKVLIQGKGVSDAKLLCQRQMNELPLPGEGVFP
ncbi:MAG: hypothetical protein C0621_10910 [Desulfuromonas sp.]|nr:MAG: hypothetical protein C0621_10910 [Desulfuromonas sp.]